MTMDANDRRMFTASLRDAFGNCSEARTDAALDDVGWRDALLDDPPTATAVLFAIQGERATSSSALDDVVAVALGAEPAADTAVLLPPIGTAEPPARVIGERVNVHGVGTRRMIEASQVLLVVGEGCPEGERVMSVSPSQLEIRQIAGMDPTGGWVEVRAVLPASSDDDAVASWTAAKTAGQLAIAAELVGNSRAMLGLARSHAVEREQFGVPIASFQAVRHRLAEALFAVESADGAVSAGWDDSSAYAAAMAKAIAGRSAKTVARHAQQVLAGMGFTSEHQFHRYFKRSLVLDQVFGSSASLSEAIGHEVLRTGQLPPVRPL